MLLVFSKEYVAILRQLISMSKLSTTYASNARILQFRICDCFMAIQKRSGRVIDLGTQHIYAWHSQNSPTLAVVQKFDSLQYFVCLLFFLSHFYTLPQSTLCAMPPPMHMHYVCCSPIEIQRNQHRHIIGLQTSSQSNRK